MSEQTIVMKNFNQGGIADSKFSGVPSSVAMMVGVDIHREPGVIHINNEPAEDTDGDVNEFCKASVAASNGLRYWFSSTSGKVWEDNNGVWTLVYTSTPTTGSAACFDAIEYERYIYWAVQNYIYRIAIRNTGNWTTGVEEEYMNLNLDQEEFNGTGDTYTATTGVNEGVTHRFTFTPKEATIIGIGVHINAKGSGNITLKVHNSADVEQKSVTVNNGDLVTGWNLFKFSSDWSPSANTEYHLHIYSSVANAEISSFTADDLETGYLRVFTNASSGYHPMVIQNKVLYIGDRQYVHQIETFSDGTTTASNFALDLPSPYHITDIGIFETDIVLGTYVANNVNEARVFRWNGWSDSFSSSDGVEEVGVRSFIHADNYLFAVVGLNGKIYFYNGARLEPTKQIPGTYSPTSTMDVYPNATATYRGIQIFGVSKAAGNATKQGIWSFGNVNMYYPKVLNLEFPISKRISGEFTLEDIEIGAILVVGNDLYFSWKWDNGSDPAEYGIDKLNHDIKLDKAYIESRAVTNHRHLLNTFRKILVNYVSLSDNANIEVEHKLNYAADWSADSTDSLKDAQRMNVATTLNKTAAPFEARIIFRRDTEDTSLAPIVESVYIIVE